MPFCFCQAKSSYWKACTMASLTSSTLAFFSASRVNRSLAGATCALIFWEEAPADADFAEPLAHALAVEFCPAEDARVAIIIGPEGGLEAAEVQRISAMTPHPAVVTLGNTILRTETAGVVAPALVLHELRRLAQGR